MRLQGSSFLSTFLLASSAAASEDKPPVCGDTCIALPQRSYLKLQNCFNEAFPKAADQEGLGFFKLPKITYPEDEAYYRARETQFGNMRPAMVFMAESEEDVVKAVKCSVAAGYKISPRGRAHSYQGMSNYDGYVVIDCSMLCKPDEFEYDMEGGDWILPGQKYIGTVTSGSGCTNAVMLSTIHKKFDPVDAALYAIGTCPSVGITGYTVGGGAGEITPYVGYGADDILGLTMVLWDGSVIKANSTHNEDIFWATQGGGSGLGVITSLTTVIPRAPDPPAGSNDRKYTWTVVDYATLNEKDRKKFLTAFSDFQYKVDPSISSKYGGGGRFDKESKKLKGLFLGSAAEFLSTFREVGLLDESTLDSAVNSKLLMSYDEICDGSSPCSSDKLDIPTKGVTIAEFDSYGEAILYKLCTSITSWDAWIGVGSTMTQSSGDWCTDLGISSDFCTTVYAKDYWTLEMCVSFGFPEDDCVAFLEEGISKEECEALGLPEDTCMWFTEPLYVQPICEKQEVLAAMVEAASDPSSFINTQGQPQWFLDTWGPFFLDGRTSGDFQPTNAGGLMIPNVDIDTLMDLDEAGLQLQHFQHGAPLLKSSDETAFPWRNAAIMIGFVDGDEQRLKVLNRMADYYGDQRKQQGYYNYMAPLGNPNWRYFYFGQNYERLTQIKSKYDPADFFGLPQTPERALSMDEGNSKAGKDTKAAVFTSKSGKDGKGAKA